MLQLTADTQKTNQRLAQLQAFLNDKVLDSTTKEFRCSHANDCKASARSGPDRDFFSGQLRHVGYKYDLMANGKPLRVVVIGKSYGGMGDADRGEKHCDLDKRYDMIMDVSKYSVVWGSGRSGCRNQHMSGTTFLLRLIFGCGLENAVNHDSEFVCLSGDSERTHLFDMFALLDFVLCSAVTIGNSSDRTTPTMVSNCSPFLHRALEILQPNLVISQGVADWLEKAGVCRQKDQKGIDGIEEVNINGCKALLLKFTHPSAHGQLCWGNSPRDKYLLQTVKPTVEEAMCRVLGA